MPNSTIEDGLVKIREVLNRGLTDLSGLMSQAGISIHSDELEHCIDKCAIILRNNKISILDIKASCTIENVVKIIDNLNREVYSQAEESFDNLRDHQSLHINSGSEILNELIEPCIRNILLTIGCYAVIIQIMNICITRIYRGW